PRDHDPHDDDLGFRRARAGGRGNRRRVGPARRVRGDPRESSSAPPRDRRCQLAAQDRAMMPRATRLVAIVGGVGGAALVLLATTQPWFTACGAEFDAVVVGADIA